MIIAESGTAWAHESPEWRKSRVFQYAFRAKEAGADYFKVQMFVPNEPLFCPMSGDEKRWKRWNDSLLTFDDWVQIKQTCLSIGIGFMASVFQKTAVKWVNDLGNAYHKVASRAIETYPYHAVPDNCDVIVSNGLNKKWPSDDAIRGIFTRLHCVSEYPCPLKGARWPETEDFSPDDDETYGLSDHSGTPWPAIDALARGAEIVEVHFKLDDDGPDAASSVTVEELKMICDFQRALKEMRG